jgi:hypothetical protein
VQDAATTSNCTEFIEGGHFKDIDDGAANLFKEMEKNKEAIVAIIT